MNIATLRKEDGTFRLARPKLVRRALVADHITHLERNGRTVAMRKSVIDGENFYTLDFNNRTCEQTNRIAKAQDIVIDYLNQGAHDFGADLTLSIYVNQGEREASVLAVIGTKVLVEYEMPAGTTALLEFDAKYNELRDRKNVAYRTIAQRWIDAIHEAGTDWIGFGQRMVTALPLPEAS